MWLFSCCNTIYILQTVLKILMNLTVLHERDRSSHRSASSTCLPRITCALCCCFYFKLAILVTLYQFQESGTLVKVTNQPHWAKMVSFDVYIQSTEYTLSVFLTWLGGCLVIWETQCSLQWSCTWVLLWFPASLLTLLDTN